jgi:hypothetical protein
MGERMPRPKVQSVRRHVRLSPESNRLLAEIAKRRDVDMSATVRQLIAEEARRLGIKDRRVKARSKAMIAHNVRDAGVYVLDGKRYTVRLLDLSTEQRIYMFWALYSDEDWQRGKGPSYVIDDAGVIGTLSGRIPRYPDQLEHIEPEPAGWTIADLIDTGQDAPLDVPEDYPHFGPSDQIDKS